MTARKPPETAPPRPAEEDRRARQAEALRANLRRRKAASRAAPPKGQGEGRPSDGKT